MGGAGSGNTGPKNYAPHRSIFLVPSRVPPPTRTSSHLVMDGLRPQDSIIRMDSMSGAGMNPHPRQRPDCCRSMLAGAAAGVSADAALFPLDTLSTRMQAPGGLWATGGLRNLYAGLGSSLTGSGARCKSHRGVAARLRYRLRPTICPAPLANNLNMLRAVQKH